MKLYVVTQPDSVRGIYDDWADCEAAVSGVQNARYQSVSSRAEAEALLSGRGVELSPGVYAFIDGNHLGGVGVVFVLKRPNGTTVEKEIASYVERVFVGSRIVGLNSSREIENELTRLRNVLAELAALYLTLNHIAASTRLKIVHDYKGVEAWMTDRWKTRDHVVAHVVAACKDLRKGKSLHVDFVHQHGHRSTFAGRNDFVSYNTRADRLAAEGVNLRDAGPVENKRGRNG